MKKTFITGFIFCSFLAVLSFNTSAQEYKYDISKYYTPDIVRNQLDLSFNTGSSFNNSKNKVDTTRTTYSTQMGGTITPNFVTYVNTRKRISTLQINGQFSGRYYKSGVVDQSNDYKNSQTNNYLNLSYSNRFYNSSNQFLSIGITSNFQADITNWTQELNSTTSKASSKNYVLNIIPAVGIGIGRVESVEDARQAIYILDDLSKRGVLTRQLNNNEIFQLSQLISHVKNKRFLDSRLHLMEEITSVDSFFVSNKLLDKSGAPYFTSLYDNWQFGALYSRKSGQSFEINFTPSYYWNYEEDNPIDTTFTGNLKQHYLRGALSLTYTYEKPVNLNWQHSISASLRGQTSFNNTRRISGNYYDQYGMSDISSQNQYDNRSVNLAGSYTLGFYPNTRTYFRGNVSQNFYLQYSKDLDTNLSSWNKSFLSRTSMSFSIFYYFSPQLQLSAGVNLENDYTGLESTNYNGLSAGINGALSYSFF